MELYDLRSSTLAIVERLRTKHSHVGPRADGKSTALMLRAKELHDKGNAVTVLALNGDMARYLQELYRKLFQTRVPGNIVFKSARNLDALEGITGFLLIDEFYQIIRKMNERDDARLAHISRLRPFVYTEWVG